MEYKFTVMPMVTEINGEKVAYLGAMCETNFESISSIEHEQEIMDLFTSFPEIYNDMLLMKDNIELILYRDINSDKFSLLVRAPYRPITKQ